MSKLAANSDFRLARTLGWIAVIGALLAAIGDLCLLYSPNGGYLKGDYAFLKDVPTDRALWGHYLGILGIPLEAGGVYLIFLGLKPLGKTVSWGALLLGIYIIYPGVTYHGSIYPMVFAAQSGPEALSLFQPFNEPLAVVFVGGFLVLMAGLSYIILKGGSRFPKWLVLASPLVTYSVWMGFYFVWPAVGNVLAPAGFNLSMAILFAAILLSGSLKGSEG